MNLVEELYKNQDVKYGDFNANLSPTLKREQFIGVRVPILRKIAKEFFKCEDSISFMHSLPHTYFEENMIHCLLITQIKDYKTCIQELKRFLPYVDNWAVSDTMTCKIFKKYKEEILKEAYQWMESSHTYTIRYGIDVMMTFFLDEDFKEEYNEKIASIRSDEYYVNMMIAWYFATALAKQWDSTINILTENKLERWTHNKTIQKAIESFRITDEQKIFLRTLKRPK